MYLYLFLSVVMSNNRKVPVPVAYLLCLVALPLSDSSTGCDLLVVNEEEKRLERAKWQVEMMCAFHIGSRHV